MSKYTDYNLARYALAAVILFWWLFFKMMGWV